MRPRSILLVPLLTAGACGDQTRTVDASLLSDAAVSDAIPVDPLAALPPVTSAIGVTFLSADFCAACHEASAAALRDATGRDVSPSKLYPQSMMSLASRDPYYLAAFAREMDQNPAAQAHVEDLCTRCHAPQGARELEPAGERLTFAALVADLSEEAALGREGVGCTGCHQITEEELGKPTTAGGLFKINWRREIYGPHADPFAEPMRHHVAYTPVQAPHVTKSDLCASCHTVLLRALDQSGAAVGPEIAEQATFLEWRNSSFRDGSCQRCHFPTVDQDGVPIETPIASHPEGMDPRKPFGRHLVVGGNAYMLELIGDNATWTGIDVPPEDLRVGAEAASAMLATAATVEVTEASQHGNKLNIEVRVINGAGHKFPTGFPTRRAWLHLTVRDASGKVVFESGRVDGTGALVDAQGKRLDGLGTVLMHRDRITSDSEVQVWEAVLGDEKGAPTHEVLRAWSWIKDNRLLPEGWSADHGDAERTEPVGTGNDSNFRAGGDTVRYEIAVSGGATTVDVELLYQSVPPVAVEAMASRPTPAGVAFVRMARMKPPRPSVVATATAAVHAAQH